MQGRFFTVLMSMSGSMAPIGLLVAGPLADRFGVQLWFLIATVSLLAMGVIVLLTPSMMRMEDYRAPQPEAVPAD
jgi:MFS transporter, DHA3 family, macrolide efflux protein